MPRPGQINRNKEADVYGDFSRRQKTAVIFLAVLSLAAVAVWLIQINSQIRKPFASPDKKTESAVATLNLSLMDSDGDGLSDYDELYVYGTSPYLEDSDSDGISDYDEIMQGTDPNCPTGKDCYGSDFLVNQDGQDTSGFQVDDSLIVPPTGDVPQHSTSILNPEEVTPEILRQILLESGYEAEVLNEISDEDLMASYQEALLLGSEGAALE